MRFKIPGRDVQVRLVERVATTDPQYDIFDVGLEYSDGSIDSLIVPGSGSYSSAKTWIKTANDKAEADKTAAVAA